MMPLQPNIRTSFLELIEDDVPDVVVGLVYATSLGVE